MPSECRECGAVSHDQAVHCSACGAAGAMARMPCQACSRLTARLAEAERERDAYRKAKAENDERFMCERDAALARAEKAESKLTEYEEGSGPDWCCADCGSRDHRGIVYPGTPNGPEEYDMCCNACGSLNIAESCAEAASELGDKLDTATAERDALRAEVEHLRVIENVAREWSQLPDAPDDNPTRVTIHNVMRSTAQAILGACGPKKEVE